MHSDTIAKIPEGYRLSGLAHQPSVLRQNTRLVEGQDFVIIGGSARMLSKVTREVVAIHDTEEAEA